MNFKVAKIIRGWGSAAGDRIIRPGTGGWINLIA